MQREGWQRRWEPSSPVRYRREVAKRSLSDSSYRELEAWAARYSHSLPRKRRMEAGLWGAGQGAAESARVPEWASSRSRTECSRASASALHLSGLPALQQQREWGQWEKRDTQQHTASPHRLSQPNPVPDATAYTSDTKENETSLQRRPLSQPPGYIPPPPYNSPHHVSPPLEQKNSLKETVASMYAGWDHRVNRHTYCTLPTPRKLSDYSAGYQSERGDGGGEEFLRRGWKQRTWSGPGGHRHQEQATAADPWTTGAPEQVHSQNTPAQPAGPSPLTLQQTPQPPQTTHLTEGSSTIIGRKLSLKKRRGAETIFCLVSRMGGVAGLSSSAEDPLKPLSLPLFASSSVTDVPIAELGGASVSSGGDRGNSHSSESHKLADEVDSGVPLQLECAGASAQPADPTGDGSSSLKPNLKGALDWMESDRAAAHREELLRAVHSRPKHGGDRNPKGLPGSKEDKDVIVLPESTDVSAPSPAFGGREVQPLVHPASVRYPLWREPSHMGRAKSDSPSPCYMRVKWEEGREARKDSDKDRKESRPEVDGGHPLDVEVRQLEIKKDAESDSSSGILVIDATCVVVRVEFIFPPKKEHVHYLCSHSDPPVPDLDSSLSLREPGPSEHPDQEEATTEETPSLTHISPEPETEEEEPQNGFTDAELQELVEELRHTPSDVVVMETDTPQQTEETSRLCESAPSSPLIPERETLEERAERILGIPLLDSGVKEQIEDLIPVVDTSAQGQIEVAVPVIDSSVQEQIEDVIPVIDTRGQNQTEDLILVNDSSVQDQTDNLILVIDPSVQEQTEDLIPVIDPRFQTEDVKAVVDTSVQDQIEDVVPVIDPTVQDQIEDVVPVIDPSVHDQIEDIIPIIDSSVQDQREDGEMSQLPNLTNSELSPTECFSDVALMELVSGAPSELGQAEDDVCMTEDDVTLGDQFPSTENDEGPRELGEHTCDMSEENPIESLPKINGVSLQDTETTLESPLEPSPQPSYHNVVFVSTSQCLTSKSPSLSSLDSTSPSRSRSPSPSRYVLTSNSQVVSLSPTPLSNADPRSLPDQASLPVSDLCSSPCSEPFPFELSDSNSLPRFSSPPRLLLPFSPSVSLLSPSSSPPYPDPSSGPETLVETVNPIPSQTTTHKEIPKYPKTLWDAVNRIRKHTAPDSENEEEEGGEQWDPESAGEDMATLDLESRICLDPRVVLGMEEMLFHSSNNNPEENATTSSGDDVRGQHGEMVSLEKVKDSKVQEDQEAEEIMRTTKQQRDEKCHEERATVAAEDDTLSCSSTDSQGSGNTVIMGAEGDSETNSSDSETEEEESETEESETEKESEEEAEEEEEEEEEDVSDDEADTNQGVYVTEGDGESHSREPGNNVVEGEMVEEGGGEVRVAGEPCEGERRQVETEDIEIPEAGEITNSQEAEEEMDLEEKEEDRNSLDQTANGDLDGAMGDGRQGEGESACVTVTGPEVNDKLHLYDDERSCQHTDVFKCKDEEEGCSNLASENIVLEDKPCDTFKMEESTQEEV